MKTELELSSDHGAIYHEQIFRLNERTELIGLLLRQMTLRRKRARKARDPSPMMLNIPY